MAIVDIVLKTGDGIDLIKRIRRQNDVVRMLVWSMYDEELYAERAERRGRRVPHQGARHGPDRGSDSRDSGGQGLS